MLQASDFDTVGMGVAKTQEIVNMLRRRRGNVVGVSTRGSHRSVYEEDAVRDISRATGRTLTCEDLLDI